MTSAPHADRMTRREAAGIVGGLFERHGRMVYGVCRAMLRDVHEAEDATQQVFLSAYQALLGGARVREPGGWLATIARNECRARIADGMRRPLPVADEDLERRPAERDEHLRRSQVDELRSAFAELPERQREAVVLRYLYGLRYGEVATALGLSRPATEALLFRARRSMRLRLRPVVGAALVVPSVVRDELALALPGFGDGGYGGAAAAGLAGSLLVKLTGGSVGLKAATAVVAVSTVGLVGALPADRVDRADGPQRVALGDLEDEGGASHGLELGRGARPETSSPETPSVDSSGSTPDGGGAEDDRGSGRSDSARGDDGPGDSGGAQATSSGPGGTDDHGDTMPASEPAPAPTDDGPETTDGGSSGGSDGSSTSGGAATGYSGHDQVYAESGSSSGSSGSGESSGSGSGSGSSGSGSGSSGSEAPDD